MRDCLDVQGFGEQEVHCISKTVPVKTQNGWLSQLKLDLKLNWKLRSHGTGWLPSFPRGKTPTPNCINTNKPTICIYEHRIGRLFFLNAHKTISMAWAWLHLSGLSLQLCCFVTHTKTLAPVLLLILPTAVLRDQNPCANTVIFQEKDWLNMR